MRSGRWSVARSKLLLRYLGRGKQGQVNPDSPRAHGPRFSGTCTKLFSAPSSCEGALWTRETYKNVSGLSPRLPSHDSGHALRPHHPPFQYPVNRIRR